MFKSFYGVYVVLSLLAFPAFGKTNAEIEQELLGHISTIQQWATQADGSHYEQIENENKVFKEKLLSYAKNPATLGYPFAELAKHLYISTSEDGKFRIYSWDSESGGTMHFFETVYQFQTRNGAVDSYSDELVNGDAGGFVSDIFDLETKNGTVYLARFSSIYSTSDNYQAIRLFAIENNALNRDKKLIKTKSGLTSSLGFDYNLFSVVERKERPLKLILYDKKNKTIKIPVVIKDEKLENGEKFTGKFINYKFDGTYFLKKK